VGETAKLDDKGRITLPAEVRKVIGKKAFRVEIAGKDTILLKALEDRHELVKKVVSIKLTGNREKVFVDAATVKDFYGGVKH